jgi:polyferredoxin
LCLTTTLLVYQLATRNYVELNISRDRNVLYRELANGDIENHFSIKILNKDRKQHAYQLSLNGIENAKLKFDDGPLEVAGAAMNTFGLRVIADPDSLPSSVNTIHFELRALDNESISVISDARFVGP